MSMLKVKNKFAEYFPMITYHYHYRSAGIYLFFMIDIITSIREVRMALDNKICTASIQLSL